MIKIFKKASVRPRKALQLLICITLLSGCALTGPSKPPVTVAEIIQMNKEGVPPVTIIERMRDSDAVYRFSAAQLGELHDMGIPDPVLNYMQQTYIDAERRTQSIADWSEWDMWGPW
jgi:hypothetical protein